MRLTPYAEVHGWNTALLNEDPREIIRWSIQTFGTKVTISCGFGAEGMVILHKAMQIDRSIRVFTLDTEMLPEATHTLIKQCEERYRIVIKRFFPDPKDLHKEDAIREPGAELFSKNAGLRKRCCEIRKVIPLRRALYGFDAWITGLRQDYSVITRTDVPAVQMDLMHGGKTKINPLARWSKEQIWDYIKAHGVPYNELYDQGYESIGCAPCTRPGKGRDGRWWWEQDGKKECGIHVLPALLDGIEH